MLHKGKKADDIAAIFAERRARNNKIKIEVGTRHELHVRELLAARPYVAKASLTLVVEQERELRDVMVIADPEKFRAYFGVALAIPRGKLWVQVKSGRGGIEHAKEMMIAKFDVEPQDLEFAMWENRLTLLKVWGPDVNIVPSFEIQLRSMNKYWINRP